MRNFLLPLPTVLALAVSPALAADPKEPVPSDPQEWAAFQDTLQRYKARMEEFQGDARDILAEHETEERQKISSSYGNAIRRMQDEESALRRVAVTRLETFLAKYPDSPHTPDMLFRLADLYFEESELDFMARTDEYSRLEAQLDNNPTMALPPPPLKDYSRSIDLYRRLIAKHPTYENIADTYYMLAWCLSAPNADQFDPEKARDVYVTIVQKFPKSEFSNDANMRLGEYYFDLPGPRGNPTMNVPTAISYYEAVLADGPTGRNYEKAIYKLGWSHYKINDYDKALNYLVTLLDYSDKQFVEGTGKVSDMRPEAVEYLAISYADMADRRGRSPVQEATEHLKKVGDRKWQHEVVERLAQILFTQAKFEASIETYRYLQEKWPLDPNNPVYQNEIATIYMKMPIPDLEKSGQAMTALSEKYTEGTAWYNANRSNPDAIAKARGYIETSLAQVAVELLLKAKDAEARGDSVLAASLYRMASDKFGEFLDKFPFADDYDTYEWYRALALVGSNQFQPAEQAYVQILKNNRSQYRDGARYQLMKMREQIVLAKYGKVPVLPQDAVVERVETSAFGKEIRRYTVSDEQKAFIASADDLVDRQFTDPDWAPVLERDRSALAYLPAQILYEHGRYDEARPRLLKVIQKYPGTPNAEFACGLLVNTYTNEGDLEKVTETIDACGGTRFPDIKQQAKFELARRKGEKGDHLGSANAFLEFMKEFPTSEYVDEALYNAANQFDLAGKTADANRLFEKFIADYPKEDRAKGLYFRIADGYSKTLELNKAIAYYEQLARNFPDYKDAPAALYNAAFLRVGIGDHVGAAKAFEKYATTFPDQADAEATFWRAGEQWALVSENDAIDFYNRYVKRYPSNDGNHVIEAYYRVAKIYEGRKDARRAAQAWTQVQAAYGANAGANLTSHTRGLAAEGALNQLLARFDAFKVVKWTPTEAKNVDILVKQKPEELKAITEEAVRLIQTYQDYDTAAAALYIQGMTYFAYADMAYNIPSPKGLNEDEEAIFRQTIDEQFRIGSEDRGKARLVAALEKARGEKRWSEWNTKALVALNERYPSDFPAERKESRGASSGFAIPLAGPESLKVAAEPEPAVPAPGTPAPGTPTTPTGGGQ